MPDWLTLQALLDDGVDDAFAETITLRPWIRGDYSHAGGPDPTRQDLTTRGIFRAGQLSTQNLRGSNVAGRGTITAGEQQIQLYVSFTEDSLGPQEWRQNDRVIVRGKIYEIDYIEPSSTGRPRIHLLVVNDDLLRNVVIATSLTNHAPSVGRPALTVHA